MPKSPPPFSGNAIQRGLDMRFTALVAALRWGYVSDLSLTWLFEARYDTYRPRYGYDAWKRGYLTRHAVPAGIRLQDGRFVYSISKKGREWLESLDELAVVLHPLLNLHRDKRRKTPWSQMQHLLDLQRIAVADRYAYPYNMPHIPNWFSEPETRSYLFDQTTIPDLIVLDRVSELNLADLPDGEDWVEYEKSPKNDLRLAYLIQRYAELFQKQDDSGEGVGLGKRMLRAAHVVVPNEYQRDRYQAAFASRRAPQVVYNARTRHLTWMTGYFIDAADAINGRVVVMTLNEALEVEE